MKILGIDTSTKVARVTLLNDDTTIAKQIDNEITHSEKLMPLIDNVLNEQNIKISDMDLYACTTGPGSFTGIRIALATIKAFAKVHNKDIYAINTLELLASTVNSKTNNIISFIDAKNSRYYYQVFKSNGNSLIPLTNAKNKEMSQILEDIKEYITDETIFISNTNCMVLNNFESGKCIVKELDTNVLVDLAKNAQTDDNHIFNYLTLDATYARSSEAERTKYGE